jgi:hypothetical protein
MRYVIRIGLLGLLCLPFLFTLCCSGHPRQQPASRTLNSEVEDSSVATDLEPRLYWFYEGMKRLRDVRTEGNEVRGVFLDRNWTFSFQIDSRKLKNNQDRTAGYKMAIERIIRYLAPGAFADAEDTHKELAVLEKSLQTMTGLNFNGYEAWKVWFRMRGKNLEWSDEKQLMIDVTSPKPALTRPLPKPEDIFTIAINPIPSLPASTPRYFTADSLREALPSFRPGEAEVKVGARRIWIWRHRFK